MSTIEETLERLFAEGEFVRMLSACGVDKRNLTELAPPSRLLVAQALAQVGRLDEAMKIVERERVSATTPAVCCQIEWLLALDDWRAGDPERARRHAQQAVQLALEAGRIDAIAWAHLHLLRLRIEIEPINTVTAALVDTRRAVDRLGEARAIAYLHTCVATLEGQRGRLDEASRHLDIASRLLEGYPNAWLSGATFLNRGNISVRGCDFDTATTAFRAAIDTTRVSGHFHTRVAAQGNLGLVHLLTGKLDVAKRMLSALINEAGLPFLWKVSAVEDLARVHLAMGRLDECEQALATIRHAIEHDHVGAMYHVRWAAITRARLLVRRRQFAEALDVLDRTIDQARTLGDGPLAAAVHLLAAQALAHRGFNEAVAARLLEAHRAGITAIPDLQAQYYYGASLILRSRPGPLQSQLRDRALRLWQAQGIASIQLEMDDGLEVQSTARTPGRNRPLDTAARVADALATFPDLAARPRLLGAEVLAVIGMLDCSPEARIVATHADGPPQPVTGDELAVTLGQERQQTVTLVCRAPADPAAAILLGGVVSACRAAVELEELRRADRNRAALWPAETAEAQAGALFLAEEMRALLDTARRIAPTAVPVLITGETGTGKEVLARTIHAYSTRAKATFLPFNCTSTPRDMLDSQLFGHRRGAFTGATESFKGVIRAAAGGTLFLDEIGDVGLDVQPKLLRFLEANEVHPVGETHPTTVDVRLIAATNANLEALVAEGRFREDLFYRLHVVKLHVPPLRERREEIPALAGHYLRKYGAENQKGDLRLAEETMEYLLLYRWPGNVRQLANEMRRLAALAEPGAVLMPEHLSPAIAASRRTIPAAQRPPEPTEVLVRLDQPMAAAVEHVERAQVQWALARTGGQMEDTARLLGLSRKGLYLKRQRYGIQAPAI